jgi:hypothetical protein
MRSTGSVPTQFWQPVTAREGTADRRSIVPMSATSAEESINQQYRARRTARSGGVRLPRNFRGFLGHAPKIGVDMPLMRAAEGKNPQPVTEANRRIDAAGERPMTGVDAA